MRANENVQTSLEDDDEEVSICVDEDGNVAVLADQVSDYTLRPRELEGMCLWDFVAKAEKGYGGVRDQKKPFWDEISSEELEELNSEDEEYGDDTHDIEKAKRKQGTVEKYKFLPGHREADRKHVRLRIRDAIPVPIGPALPRRDQPEMYSRHCRLMAIMFKPWQTYPELRGLHKSWEAVFKELVPEMDPGHQQVMDNMQVLHECRDSRDEHMQTRFRERSRGSAGRDVNDRGAGNDVEEIDMGEVLDHLEEIERMSSRRLNAASRETLMCLEELENVGFFETTRHSVAAGNCSEGVEVASENDGSLEDEWKDKYDKRKAAWKLEAREVAEESGTIAISSVGQFDNENDAAQDIPLICDVDMVVNEPAMTISGSFLMKEIAEKWTLNVEQRRAFDIIARHTLEDKPEQLLMYLGGPGGTRKSRVVNTLREFFSERKETRQFRLAAYTGVAARNIGGATLHALLQMNEGKRDLSAKAKRNLEVMWEATDYLFVDEVSMLGCEMLHNVSRALTEAKGCTTAFGGVNVIFAGDFTQLPPIGDTRLYRDINTASVMAAATNRGQGKALGRLLWVSVETVVMLDETMRQSGSTNVSFVDLLGRMCDGVCNERDYDILAGRRLRGLDCKGDGEWEFAPVIVASNATRDAINCRAAEAFVERTGADLHWYHAIDTHQKAVVTDRALIERLETQDSGQTKHRLRRIPLVLGMPVAVNQNFDVAAGVVNGSYGILRRIRYFCDREGRRYLKSCIVEIPGSDVVEMPHLPVHHFPILPDTTELRFEHGGSHKRCTIKRKQVPIEPGFSMTVHKAQGRTLDRVVVDLAGCSGTEPPYVMCSRATSLGGLAVLRDFEAGQITKRRSEELRIEFVRLTHLKWKTIAKYGSNSEAQEARRKIMELQKGECMKLKRKLDGSQDGQSVTKKTKRRKGQ